MSEQDWSPDGLRFEEYSKTVKDFCLTNGLVLLNKSEEGVNHDSANCLAVTLSPTKFPSAEYAYAVQLQADYNKLIFNISKDFEFMRDSLKDIITLDDFTRRLWCIYENVNKEGVAQPISLSILRNDFMLDGNKQGSVTTLSQIEINTVSCSFGAATSHVAKLHEYMLKYTKNQSVLEKHVGNTNLEFMAKNIVKGWELYQNPKAVIVFLVSSDERNIGDQRLLEYKCMETRKDLLVRRYTFADIHRSGKIDMNKKLIVNEEEVGLVYYRTGYDPNQYTCEQDWDVRLMIERSKAIKCPTIQMHLTGCKVVQSIMAQPGIVEKYVESQEAATRIRNTFVDIYDINDKNLEQIVHLIGQSGEEFVLKPQREGGGNNIYKSDIKKFVDSLTDDKNDLKAFILQKLVKPILNENYIVKTNAPLQKLKMISELGIFSVLIADGDGIIHNETGGYLLRSKPFGVNEGGVATGYSALDSIYLV